MVRRSLASLLPLASVVTLAAWCSRAVLDLVPDGSAPLRVAMFPPPLTVLPIAVLAMGGLWTWLLLTARLGRRGTARRRDESGGLAPVHVLTPLYAVGVTIVPYLPVAADAVPLLQAFAGPLGTVLWAVSAAAALAATVQWIRGQRPAPNEPSPSAGRPARALSWRVPALLTLVTVLVLGTASMRLTLTPLMPGGDEPHYLVLAQSLWRDHDLKIENNHTRGDYREYYGRELAPHYLTRGADQEIYSIHPIALPVLIAPVYAAGGYRLVVFALVLIGALAAAVMWVFTRRLTGSASAATVAWFAITFSVPFVFNSMSVYPEIVGALCVVVAITAGWPREQGGSDSMVRWWAAGLGVAVLPWLATKYAFMAGALGLVLALRAIRLPGDAGGPWWRAGWTRRLAAVAVPGVVSCVAWLAFFKWIWGIASPAAPYGALTQTRPAYLLVGGPGLLFDQEYGLAAYAPAMLLAAAGWWRMLKAGGAPRRLAAETLLVFAALLAAVGAFRIWWGEAAPGRPVTAGLLLGAVPIAWYYATSARDAGGRAWTLVLASSGAAISVAAVLVQNGALVASSRDGISRMLQWLGGTSEAWTLAPAYIAHAWPLASAMALGWVVTFSIATVAMSRAVGETAAVHRWPQSLLRALLAACAVLVTVAVVFPLVFAERLQDAAPVDARSRSRLIDRYSSTERPLAIAFHPFTVMSGADVVSLVRFRAAPGEWKDPQPLPLLLNMRLSLPAGRYRVTLLFAPLPEGPHRLGLRLGRIGGFYRLFDVPPTGSSWAGEFELPVDANFVGFEASKELGSAVRRVDVAPIAVSDASRRLRVGQVLSARDYGAAALFAHDERSWLEPEGTWTQGAARASLTVSPRTAGVLAIRLRSSIDNVVELGSAGWRTRVELRANEPATIDLPGVEAGRAVPLWVEAVRGQAPADRDPAVRDRRFLGVFLQFPGSTGSPAS